MYVRNSILKHEIHMTSDDCQYFLKQRNVWIKSNLAFINWLHKLKMFDKYYQKFEYFGILNHQTLFLKTRQFDKNLLQQIMLTNINTNGFQSYDCDPLQIHKIYT